MNNIASLWARLIAFLIDTAIGLTVFGALFLVVSTSDTQSALFSNLLRVTILVLFLSPLHILISSFFIEHFGGTIGKLLTGIEITNENGKHVSFWRALFRSLIGYSVSSVLFFLGFIWIIVDKRRQGWHDMISGTVVVVKRPSLMWLGLILLLCFITLDVWLGRQSIDQFRSHQKLYQELFMQLSSRA